MYCISIPRSITNFFECCKMSIYLISGDIVLDRMASGNHPLLLMKKKMFQCGTLYYSSFLQMSCCCFTKLVKRFKSTFFKPEFDYILANFMAKRYIYLNHIMIQVWKYILQSIFFFFTSLWKKEQIFLLILSLPYNDSSDVNILIYKLFQLKILFHPTTPPKIQACWLHFNTRSTYITFCWIRRWKQDYMPHLMNEG